MLAKNQAPSDINPFVPFKKEQEQTQNLPEKPVPENNKGRSFRRAGNVCEIVAGTCLNSAIVFTFHLLQIHPAGMLLAVGTAHLYFTATATGEGLNKAAVNLMTGASASLAILCSLSEPVGEWWEARESRNTAQSEIKQMYTPNSGSDIPWMQGSAIALGIIFVLAILRR